MASTDALPVPQKNVAYRLTFPYFKNDGTLITSTSSPSAQVSKDGGTIASASNTATQIATNSGVYYIDLTSGEMNADCVVFKFSDATSGAVPQVIVLYPQEAGDIKTNTTYWNGTAVASPNTAGVPLIDVGYLNGSSADLLNLDASAAVIARGTVDTGSFTATTTQFESNDITTATADHWTGRVVIFKTGTLAKQAARITAYSKVASNGRFTVTTMTSAPSNTDTFVIV